MEAKWRKTFLEYSKFPEHRDKVNRALETISKYPKEQSFVMYSGGKDSLVALHLAVTIHPGIHYWHFGWGEEFMPPEIQQEIHRIVAGYDAQMIYDEVYAKGMKDSDLPDILFFTRLRNAIHSNGWKYLFSSLRAEESRRRARMTRKDKNWMGVKDIFILRDWTWMDIWAYIISHNLKYLSHYDRYAEVMGWDRVRFSTFFDEDLQEKYGIAGIDGLLMWRYRHKK